MKRYLFILAALAFSALASPVEAANRFAVCSTTCTWDNTSTAMWSTTSGGATGASAPTASDAVVIDANTCVGGTTCTITTFSGTISAQTITWGACTASTTGCIIDASVNNTNFTLSSTASTPFSGTGTGTRKWLAGSGTYSITQTGPNPCFDMTTSTNDQVSVFSGATWSCAGTTSNNRAWNGGGFSFGATTWSGNTGGGIMSVAGNNTFASLTVGAPNYIANGATTTTITGALSFTGGSSSSITTWNTSNGANPLTVSIGSASSGSWVALRSTTTSGAAALTLTNSFDLGRNTLANGGSISTPSGGGGGRIIGG